jgi:hypothetical protein
VIPLHICTRNHDGTSSSMESRTCLEMVTELFDKFHCFVDSICCDDDASTRAMVKWSNADWMTNNNTTVPPRVMITGGKLKGKTKPRVKALGDFQDIYPSQCLLPILTTDARS